MDLLHEHSLQSVRFWSSVRERAKELLERDVDDGVDYALTEVVHCKSKSERGVNAALPECARRYLRRIIELSGAKVLVILGKHVEKAVRNEFDVPDKTMFGPLPIGKYQRYIVFLPHPNAFTPKTFAKCLDSEKIRELQAFLRP